MGRGAMVVKTIRAARHRSSRTRGIKMGATAKPVALTFLAAFTLVGCGEGSVGNAKSPSGPTGPGMPGERVQVGELNPPDTSIDGSCGNVMTGPYDDKLPVPTLLFVEADDNNARISWGPKGDSPEL